MSSFVLAIDISSQGTKAALYDKTLQQVANAFEEAAILSPEPGTAIQEPDDVMGSVRRTIENVLSDAQAKGSDIAAVAVSGQMGGVIGVQPDGSASTYYDSWLDTRCGKYAAEMREKAGKRILEITGSPVLYTHGPRILWWMHEKPEDFQKTAKFVTLYTYAVMQMCGLKADDAYLDYTCIQFSGFGDNEKKTWSDELLNMFDVPKDKMPKIVAPEDVMGKISAEFAKETGLAEGTPVVAGMGGTAATLFGTGMTSVGTVHDFAGTANVLAGVLDEYRPDVDTETVVQMRSPIDGQWFPVVYVAGGGLALRWYRDTFTGTPIAEYKTLEDEAANVPIGCDGVMFFPMFTGEALAHGSGVKACFTGLNWDDSRAHLYRAIMEGVAFEYCRDLCIMRHMYPELDYSVLKADEGAADSDLFNQIKADVTGAKVETYELADRALAADAALAAQAAGFCDDTAGCMKPPTQIIGTFTPNEESNKAYGPRCKAFCSMLDALKTVYRAQDLAES